MERDQPGAPPLLIRNLDYHLLVCFDVLMTERHVSRAAEKLDLSQPAMSGILARLREIFGDSLLVRSPRGMVPTPRSLELHEIIRSVRGQLETALSQSSRFDPATARATFKLILTDYAQFVLLPAVARRMQKEAPGIDLDIKPANTRRMGELLESGEIDLGVGYLPDPPEFLRTRELFRERFVCVARRGNPDITSAFDATAFAKSIHLRIAPGGSSHFGMLLDKGLSTLHLHRRTPLSIPNYFVAPFIVAGSDLIAFMPMRVAKLFAELLPLEIHESPVTVPEYSASMFWHDRTQHEPGHQWLRQIFLSVSESIEGDLQAPARPAAQPDHMPAANRSPRAPKRKH